MLKSLTNKLSTNASSVIVFVAAFAYLAYLNSVSPDKASDQLPLVLGAAIGLARLLVVVDGAKAKATEAAEVASVAVEVGEQSLSASQNNAASLRTVKADIRETKAGVQEAKDAVDVVHKAVNHQQDLRAAEVSELRTSLATEQAKSGSPPDTGTPITDAIKLDDAARPPTTP